MKHFRILFVLLTGLFMSGSLAAAQTLTDVPEPLQPWVDWVKQKDKCPQVTGKSTTEICAWPETLELTRPADDAPLLFLQTWQAYKPSLLPLPGDARAWPENVTVDGSLVPVVNNNGQPVIKVEKGTHRVTGALPGAATGFALPDSVAAVSYTTRLGPQPVFIDTQHQLWFEPVAVRERPEIRADKNSLSLKAYRRFQDNVPTEIDTILKLSISGKTRVVELGKATIDQAIPLSIRSKLAATIDAQGNVSIIARPGNWQIAIRSYLPADEKIWRRSPHPNDTAGIWSGPEYWFFLRNPDLYQTEISGGAAVDPQNVKAPNNWNTLAGYLVRQADKIQVKRVSRGTQAEGETVARIQRDAWLDFAGKELYIRDRLSGTALPYSALTVRPPLIPEAIYLDAKAQVLIENDDGVAVSMRNPRLNATVLGTTAMGRGYKLPGNPYMDLKAEHIDTTLHLPPGWKVLGTSGGVIGADWYSRWTFYDFFALIIVFLIMQKWLGIGWGLFAFAALALSHYDLTRSGLGQNFYLFFGFISITAMMLKGLGKYPKLKNTIQRLQQIAAVFLGFTIVGYTFLHVVDGIHPELSWQVGHSNTHVFAKTSETVELQADMAAPAVKELRRPQAAPYSSSAGAMVESYISREDGLEQTRPDRHKRENELRATSSQPTWQGATTHYQWTQNALHAGDDVQLYLMTPLLWLLYGLVSSALLIILFMKVLGLEPLVGIRKISAIKKQNSAILPVLIAAALSSASLLPSPIIAAEGQFPPDHLLQELERRINPASLCQPSCASLDQVHLNLNERGELTMQMTAQALEQSAIELLDLPEKGLEILHLKAENHQGVVTLPLIRRGNRLLSHLDAGTHKLLLTAAVSTETLQIGFPAALRTYAEKLAGWTSSHERGDQGYKALAFKINPVETTSVNNSQSNDAEIIAGLAESTIPPYFEVHRQLVLSDGIFLQTTVRRASQSTASAELSISAWPQEVLITANKRISRDQDKILIRFGAKDSALHFESSLQLDENEIEQYSGGVFRQIEIPPAGQQQRTTWSFDYGPQWEIEIDGIPLIQGTGQNFGKKLLPWPGESARLAIYRVTPIPGDTISVQSMQTKVTPHELRAAGAGGEIDITAHLETTKAQSVILSTSAQINTIKVNGRKLNNAAASTVRIPLDAGSFAIHAAGELNSGLQNNYAAPKVAIKTQDNTAIPLRNVTTEVQLPRDRWVYFAGGTGVGPKFLIWSLIPTVILIAVALHYLRLGALGVIGWFWVLLGFTQANSFGLYFGLGISALLISWLVLVRKRQQISAFEIEREKFNAMQILIVLLAALIFLSMANGLYAGLLGNPKMQVAGNGSHAYLLRWFSDIGAPETQVMSVPLLYYRLILLAWEVWLSIILIGWAKMAWEAFSQETLWRAKEPQLSTTPDDTQKDETTSAKWIGITVVVILILLVLMGFIGMI